MGPEVQVNAHDALRVGPLDLGAGQAASTSTFGYLRFTPSSTSRAWAIDPALTTMVCIRDRRALDLRPGHFQWRRRLAGVLTSGRGDRHA